jgi:hypothetical protein
MFVMCAGTRMRDVRSAVKPLNWFAYMLLPLWPFAATRDESFYSGLIRHSCMFIGTQAGTGGNIC